MNKPIINGIDVSECKFYEEMRELPDNLNGGYYIEHYYCNLQGDNYCICNKNPNCYFKQLQRLKQENKKLKEVTNEAKIEYENLLINRNDFAERAYKLEQENKRLQMLSCANCGEKYLSPDGSELYEKNVQLQKENKELKAEIDRQKETIIYLQNYDMCHKTLIQYKQALEEIREMLETCLKFTTCEKCKFYKKCNKDIEECIITTIKEVLNENS